MNSEAWVKRNKDYTLTDGKSGFSLNVAGMKFTDEQISDLKEKFVSAHAGMKAIEAGEIKNPDEGRQVTHFTDRPVYRESALFAELEQFVSDLRSGEIKGCTGKKIQNAVINGIGGSALGPQLMQFAVNGPYWNELSDAKRDGFLKIYFVDNTDSAGFADVMNTVDLEETIICSISKSGGTQETKNNLISFENAYCGLGLDFSKHACAITMKDSELDVRSRGENWVKVFEMAESIGGRTSETAIVGHLPAALAGIDFKAFLDGAIRMDEWTRNEEITENPAYLLAAMWFIAGEGKGNKNMVIVPYADRLVLLSRYFQQLVMESLGKEHDLDGNTVYQGLNVFGNKGGTDAHAFIQQLNDGRNDFFITFIEVMKDAMELPIDDKTTMADYLHGFNSGLSAALRNNDRQVIQININEVSEENLGMIIALYERAVAVYAELININAFHQPGVQSYKLAAKAVLDTQMKIQEKLESCIGFEGTIEEFSEKTGLADVQVDVEGIMAKFAENDREVAGTTVSRAYDAEKGYIYTVA